MAPSLSEPVGACWASAGAARECILVIRSRCEKQAGRAACMWAVHLLSREEPKVQLRREHVAQLRMVRAHLGSVHRPLGRDGRQLTVVRPSDPPQKGA